MLFYKIQFQQNLTNFARYPATLSLSVPMGNNNLCATDRTIDAEIINQLTITPAPNKKLSVLSSQSQPPSLSIHRLAPFQRYGYLLIKQRLAATVNEYLLQVRHNNNYDEILAVAQTTFSTPEEMKRNRPATPIFTDVIIRDTSDKVAAGDLYIVTDGPQGLQGSYQITSFNRLDDHNIKVAMHKVCIGRLLLNKKNQPESRYVQNLVESFIVNSTQQMVSNLGCHLLKLQPVSCTLFQINLFRKNSEWVWTEQQLLVLMHDCITGLAYLHSKGVSHGHISPANIFYSQSKHCYVLGGFEDACKRSFNHTIKQPCEVTGDDYYNLPELKNKVGQVVEFNPFDNDMFALAIVFLQTFFNFKPQVCYSLLESCASLTSKYPRILSPIDYMIRERPTSSQLYSFLLSQNPSVQSSLMNYSFSREDGLLNSMQFRQKLASQTGYLNKKKLISETYDALFMPELSNDIRRQVYDFYDIKGDSARLAQTAYEIANKSASKNQSLQKYATSYKIYRDLAEKASSSFQTDQALYYYSKAIEACRNADPGNHELALVLQAAAVVHGQKNQYDQARAYFTEALALTKDSPLRYIRALITSASVESEFQQFKNAENLLKEAIGILDSANTSRNQESIRLRVKVLDLLGNNLRLSASDSNKPEAYYEKAQICLEEAISINQGLVNSSADLASNYENLGHVQFDWGNFTKALEYYEKGLIFRRHEGSSNVECGEAHVYIANCFKLLRQPEQALENYNRGLSLFRKQLGSDHNQHSAVALGNIGIVHLENGQAEQGRQEINLAKSIIGQLLGESCPDYEYFSRYA